MCLGQGEKGAWAHSPTTFTHIPWQGQRQCEPLKIEEIEDEMNITKIILKI